MRSPTTATVAAALLLGVSSLAIAAPSAVTSGAVTGTIVTTPMAREATN
jgi:Spy/CpxP family protein refolding chaperone